MSCKAIKWAAVYVAAALGIAGAAGIAAASRSLAAPRPANPAATRAAASAPINGVYYRRRCYAGVLQPSALSTAVIPITIGSMMQTAERPSPPLVLILTLTSASSTGGTVSGKILFRPPSCPGRAEKRFKMAEPLESSL